MIKKIKRKYPNKPLLMSSQMERDSECKLGNNIKWYITHVRQRRSQK